MRANFPLDEYQDRWMRTERELVARDYDTAVIMGKTAQMFDRAADIFYLTSYFSTKFGQPCDTSNHKARAYCAIIFKKGKAPELIVDEPGFFPDVKLHT